MSQLSSTRWTITGWLDACVRKRTQVSIVARGPRMSQLLSTRWIITGWLDAYVRKRTQLSSGLGYHREFLRDASVDTGWSSSLTLLQTSMRCPCKLGPYFDFVLVKTVLGNEFPILVLSP